ncbi:MAG: cation:proton antiporter subunit C [Corynebacterium sp.]|nr:cation:proton antiporter subunit C [Corynebacterium sp.]
MIIALMIAILMGAGVYLVLQRGMVRIVLGMGLISHGTNLLILSAGIGKWRSEAFPSRTDLSVMADPLPQAFVLTAIVITMATTAFMLALAALGRNDDTLSNANPDVESEIDTLGGAK